METGVSSNEAHSLFTFKCFISFNKRCKTIHPDQLKQSLRHNADPMAYPTQVQVVKLLVNEKGTLFS